MTEKTDEKNLDAENNSAKTAGQSEEGGSSEKDYGNLLISDRSAKPSAVKIGGWIGFCDFICAIVYGILVESANNNIDAQMNTAPAFLITMAALSLFLFFYIRKNLGAVVGAVEIYDRAAVIHAPELAGKAKRAHADDETVTRKLERGDVAAVSSKGGRIYITCTDGRRYLLERMKKAEIIGEKLLTDYIE
jgi:hypothetical protein